jgi:hypothetical protein
LREHYRRDIGRIDGGLNSHRTRIVQASYTHLEYWRSFPIFDNSFCFLLNFLL